MDNNIKIDEPLSDEVSARQLLLTQQTVSFTKSKDESIHILLPPEQFQDKPDKKSKKYGTEVEPPNHAVIPDQPNSTHSDDDKNHQNKDFLGISKNTIQNSNYTSDRRINFSMKQTFIVISSVILAVGVVIGLGLYLHLRKKDFPLSLEQRSTSRRTTILTTAMLPGTTTVDPNTIETRINESFYSYNFL